MSARADLFETTKIKLEGTKRNAARVLRCIWHPNRTLIGSLRKVKLYMAVGRGGEGVDFVLPEDPTISRRHATITGTADSGEFVIEDHDTANGTFVNGIKVVGKQPLPDNSIVRMGETLFEFAVGATGITGGDSTDPMVGISPAFVRMTHEADNVATADMSVLLVGQSGTGKARLAERIHARSGRTGPLVTIHCGNPNERAGLRGEAESRASNGTLVIEDVDLCEDAQQLELLNTLRSEKSDYRVIATSASDVVALVGEGKFRRDLYARLAGFLITLPALSERRADIPVLIERFYRDRSSGDPLNISAEMLERLVLTPWEINLHGLRIVADRLVNQPEGVAPDVELLLRGLVIKSVDARNNNAPSKEALQSALQQFQGKVALVAAHFGKDRKQIYRFLERYGIDPESFR